MAEQRRGNGGREALAESIAGSIASASKERRQAYKKGHPDGCPFLYRVGGELLLPAEDGAVAGFHMGVQTGADVLY